MILTICLFILIGFALFIFSSTEESDPVPSVPRTADDSEVRCIRCNSIQIHAEKRGWTLLSGFIGSSTIYMTCLKCGCRFRPGEKRFYK